MEVLQQKSDELTRQRTETSEAQKTIHTRLVTNQTALQNICEKATDLEQLEKQYQWLQALSDTVNGRLRDREKIALETYIQMTFFDRIIQRANLRLLVMSGGQYELKRRMEADNNRSQSGLELDVIDHYNGSERSVKSLSGGESFKASLSLALGLSDEVQSAAGAFDWTPCLWMRDSAPWMRSPLPKPSGPHGSYGRKAPGRHYLPCDGTERKNRETDRCNERENRRQPGRDRSVTARVCRNFAKRSSFRMFYGKLLLNLCRIL